MAKQNKLNKYLKLFSCIIICELAGFLGSLFTTPAIGGWYKNLSKPFFSPPNWIFGPVWSVLFILMGVSLYLVWSEKWVVRFQIGKIKKKLWNSFSQKLWTGSWSRANIILIFYLQLFLNILWSFLFFGMHSPVLAFFEILMLWCAIIFTIVNFYRVSKTAAYLLIPYIAWVSFATILNYLLWILN